MCARESRQPQKADSALGTYAEQEYKTLVSTPEYQQSEWRVSPTWTSDARATGGDERGQATNLATAIGTSKRRRAEAEEQKATAVVT